MSSAPPVFADSVILPHAVMDEMPEICAMTGRVVCFGEILIRLSPPGKQQLLQSPVLDVCIGGAEANVAVSLARLGSNAAMVSVLPSNALGYAARDELRRYGVDVSRIRYSPGRLGTYYLTHGAALRPSQVLYDRAGSAFAVAASDLVDWDDALAGATRLHLSGITPALGPGTARAAMLAAQAANRLGVPVSIDGNYRAKLWEEWDGDSATILHDLFELVDIAFADERDVAMILRRRFDGGFIQAARAALDAFPKLRWITCVKRHQHSVDHHVLSALLSSRDAVVEAGSYELVDVVDRVGAGDAFVAGMLHAMQDGCGHKEALEFALATAVLKHSIPGDFNLIDAQDVRALVAGEGLHVRR